MTRVLNEVGLALNVSIKARWLLAALLSLGLVQLLARGMTSPLREMAAAARAMARGDYSRRVIVTSRDEVGELAQTRRLGRLVTQLLDLSRLESGVVPLERERTALAPLLTQSVREAEVADRPVELRTDVQPPELTRARRRRADAPGARQPARQRHPAQPGRRAGQRHGRPRRDRVRLVVEDTGPGIAEADRERVFERFARADSSRTGRDGGSGLGLAIARWVVDLHGGVIRAEPVVPPPGCRVVVELPDC